MYIFCTVMIFITRVLCVNSLLHRVSMLTETCTYICNYLSMGFVLHPAVIPSLRSLSCGSSIVSSQVRSAYRAIYRIFFQITISFLFLTFIRQAFFTCGAIAQLGRRHPSVKVSRSHKIRHTQTHTHTHMHTHTYRWNPLNE